MKTTFHLFLSCAVLCCTALTSWGQTQSRPAFSDEELCLIHGSDSIMRVLTIEDSSDLDVLRTPCCDFAEEDLISEDYRRLCELMIATVTHPSQDGVGIAGPQVGLSRRVVAVQRFDKPGAPFEIYPNIRIVSASDSSVASQEGCLSVPGRSGEVLRSREVVIEYDDIRKNENGSYEISTARETIDGFTAIIFQHETDHLDGILYIDRL